MKMTYRWAVRCNGVLLTRTLTEAKARRLAAKYTGAVATMEFFNGCACGGAA